MPNTAILRIKPLGFQWETADPFLFCVHHDDHYPAGNEQLGPQASLQGRNIGNDFTPQDGWRMYHGERVPGFPVHPHRGFETVTIVRLGMVDHADSMGAAGRYGGGDVQWMTAGQGVQHSEMFPLLHAERENPLELFQIWLNLPRANKMVPPHFTMLWRESIPRYRREEEGKASVEIDVIAGALENVQALSPPPDSWASNPANHVAIWTLRLAPHATWTLPAAVGGLNRTLYFFKGDAVRVDGQTVAAKHAVDLQSDRDVIIEGGAQASSFLLLQGRPINEPVAQYGPFVMNTHAEIQQAFADYRRTHFGGWPWPSHDPVHGATRGRFARHTDGRIEEPE
jgi:redox-sensitive bicupin YhaK (pirin superfamily)